MKLTINALLVLTVLMSSCNTGSVASSHKKELINVGIASETSFNYTIIKEGKGAQLKPHSEILLHETIRYLNGEQVFSTKTMGAPLTIRLGKGTIASGLEERFIGMRAGEVREFIIPASMIKRRKLHPLISPDAIVVYSVELVGSPYPKWFRGGSVRSLDSEAGC
ncbi:MAG: FKBP-type peptidyl-prolyl cis-trans isomerase [Bacteroidota bacterium]